MAALDFVQNDIRYLALPFGENSHRPFAPHEVLTRRYGDCKDKSLLLVSMLRQMGIDASPVLLATQNRRSLDQLLPSPLDFDHVIVRVRLPSGQEYYLDPTLRAQISPLARIGEAHPDTQVLVIASGETKLRKTSPARRELITETRSETVTAEAFDKPVTMHVTLSFAGLGAESLRRAMTSVTPEQWRKFYEGGLDRRHPKTQLLRAPEVKDDPVRNIASVELDYRIENFFEKEGDRWYAPYQASNLRDTFYIPTSGRRTFPLAIPSFPSVIRYQFTLALPANVDTQRRPAERSVTNPAFVASYQATQQGRQATALVELEVRADRIAAAGTPAFLADIRKVNELAGGAFDFGAADIKSANASAAGSGTYQEAAREQLERIVKGASDSLAARVLGNADQARAYCERAVAFAFLERTNEALADVAAARKRLPDDAGIVKCAATVGIVTGDLSGSINDITRAITLGLADSDSFYRRGLANYLNGKIDDATEDFARSRDLAADPNMRNRGEVWRLISLTRAGRAAKAPVPAQLDWPGPVIPMFNGTQTPDQVMQGVYANAQGEDLDILLAEAYFYVGEFYLLRNQNTLAEAYLRRSQDKGAINRLLHYAARQERARLAATRH
ncbi:MAG: transglutaminase domain-containing protein [Rhodocyclaceae bacterium]